MNLPRHAPSRALALVLLSCGLLTLGCRGPKPLPPRDEFSPDPQRPEREEAVGVLAPVERWRESLRQELDGSWTLGTIKAQVAAPPAWIRLSGDRGLALELEGAAGPQVFWVMPQDFVGEVIDPAEAAQELARNETFVLYRPAQDTPGWAPEHTAQLTRALGF